MDYQVNKSVTIPVGKVILNGELIVPVQSKGLVIFSHGSGSSRFSKRNQFVASILHQKKIGTLLFDLLTVEEDRLFENRFDIDLLTQRLVSVTEWTQTMSFVRELPIGYFGASTGAASALKAASFNQEITAVVSRGGRVDLALKELPQVKSPTLLIVGSLDQEVLILNEKAYQALHCEKKLEVVEGASHLFEESGKMEIVAELATSWFKKFMSQVNHPNQNM